MHVSCGRGWLTRIAGAPRRHIDDCSKSLACKRLLEQSPSFQVPACERSFHPRACQDVRGATLCGGVGQGPYNGFIGIGLPNPMDFPWETY